MSRRKTIELAIKTSTKIYPKAPFNFDATVYKPSHFPSPDNAWKEGTYWHTMNFQDTIYGVRMENLGEIDGPEVRLTLYSESSMKNNQLARVAEEIEWRYDMDSGISEFLKELKSDEILSPVLQSWRGMRVSCQYSLYELLIITIVLQNATVRRSVQMTKALLQKYGTLVNFDGKRLYAFWRPETLSETTEEDLRKLKVGYRARFLKKISDAFVRKEVNEFKLRTLEKEEAKKELLKLYGIGPASVGILLFESLHHYDAFDYISPWEQKIYSKLLFGKDLVSAEDILTELDKRWGRWKMLAAHYLFEDLFWKRRTQKIPWLEDMIRL